MQWKSPGVDAYNGWPSGVASVQCVGTGPVKTFFGGQKHNFYILFNHFKQYSKLLLTILQLSQTLIN